MKSNSILLLIVLSVMFIFNKCAPTQFEILKAYCGDRKFEINMNEDIIVVLIPVDGCSSCINKSIDFIKNHPKYPFHYILSSVLIRNLSYISSILPSKPEKVFYDSENTLMMQGLVNRIPKAIFLHKGKITTTIELSTDENYQELDRMINLKQTTPVALN